MNTQTWLLCLCFSAKKTSVNVPRHVIAWCTAVDFDIYDAGKDVYKLRLTSILQWLTTCFFGAASLLNKAGNINLSWISLFQCSKYDYNLDVPQKLRTFELKRSAPHESLYLRRVNFIRRPKIDVLGGCFCHTNKSLETLLGAGNMLLNFTNALCFLIFYSGI